MTQEYKYKEGDIVKIRKDLHEGNDFKVYCNGTMAQKAGSLVTIRGLTIAQHSRLAYFIKDDQWIYTEDMFEKRKRRLYEIY